jgi:uncharacterized protein (TIGR02145 family)
MTYSWYSGPTAAACTTAVAGCGNSETCAIPAANALNTVVYKRTVVSSECPAEVQQTTITVQYQGIKVGTNCWAPVNVGNTGSWAEKPDSPGGLFQYNRNKVWHASIPGSGVAIPGWITSIDENAEWNEIANPVCPAGWRLPTSAQFHALDTESGGSSVSTDGTNTNGGTWAAANARGNAVAGRFYGPKHATCSLAASGSMDGCIFLPAVGRRNYSQGIIGTSGSGNYWSDKQQASDRGYQLFFTSTSSIPREHNNKAGGMSARCMKTM